MSQALFLELEMDQLVEDLCPHCAHFSEHFFC